MNRAAASRDLHIESSAPSDAAHDDEAWMRDPLERARRIQALEHETERLYRLALAFAALWKAERIGTRAPRTDDAPSSVDLLSELARRCHVSGTLQPDVAEAVVTVARAVGVSRSRLRESYRDVLEETA